MADGRNCKKKHTQVKEKKKKTKSQQIFFSMSYRVAKWIVYFYTAAAVVSLFEMLFEKVNCVNFLVN